MKTNPGKFQFIILGKKQCNKAKLKINSIVINKSDTVELLGITIDNVLTFNEHINNFCRIASYKLYTLRRIKKYLTQDQAKFLYNAFINSHFSYMPIIWMFCRKNQYLKIQRIHHRALKVVFNSDADYDELLQMSNEITIHQKHLHALICEVFKSLNSSDPEFTWSWSYQMQNLRITALILSILGHACCVEWSSPVC